MAYTITQDYLPNKSLRRPGIKNLGIKFLVAHDTGNDGSTAKNNVTYYKNSANVMEASAHTFIDDKDIIECIPLTEKAWHVRYEITLDNERFGDDANDIAIGVELCYSTKGKFDSKKAYERYVWYLAYLCKKYGLDPRSKIIGHQHLDPSRKTDPTNALKTIGKSYDVLISDVYKEYLVQTGNKESAAVKPASKVHKVVKGETLWGISQKYGMTSTELIKLNPGIIPEKLQVGQKVNVAKATTTAPVTETKPAAKKLSASLPNKVLKKGSKGSEVKTMQEALIAIAYYPDKAAKDKGADGSYGDKTKNAVERFQKVYLPYGVDGIYGPKTRTKLAEVLVKNGK